MKFVLKVSGNLELPVNFNEFLKISIELFLYSFLIFETKRLHKHKTQNFSPLDSMLGGPADVALRICFLDLSSNPVDDKLFFFTFFYFFLETVKKLNNI